MLEQRQLLYKGCTQIVASLYIQPSSVNRSHSQIAYSLSELIEAISLHVVAMVSTVAASSLILLVLFKLSHIYMAEFEFVQVKRIFLTN